jgi:hypothetical protein
VPISVNLYPDLGIAAPGMPVPLSAPVPPVTAAAEIGIPDFPPFELLFDVEKKASSTPATTLKATVRLPAFVDQTDLIMKNPLFCKCVDSITFTPEVDGLNKPVITGGEGWKKAEFTPLSSLSRSFIEEQVYVIAVTASLGSKTVTTRVSIDFCTSPTLILQVSPSASLSVKPGQGTSFTASVWEVDDKNAQYTQVTAAAIDVAVPPDATSALGIQTSMTSGGVLTCTITQRHPVTITRAVLTINATARESSFTADVTVTMEKGAEQQLALMAEVVEGENRLCPGSSMPEFCINYNEDNRQWNFGEVVIYFHSLDTGWQNPQPPGFKPQWEAITASPQWLVFDSPTSDDGLTWRIHPSLQEGITINDLWLLHSNGIMMTVRCTSPQDGSSYIAQMGYWLYPPYILKCDFYEKESRHYDQRLPLIAGEFAADGEDELSLIAYPHRIDADGPEDAPTGIECDEWSVEFEEQDRNEFEWRENPGYNEPGKKCFLIKSRKPILYKVKNRALQIRIKTRMMIPLACRNTGSALFPLEKEVSMTLRPAFMVLKVLVIPGKVRNTSEIYAAAYLETYLVQVDLPYMRGIPLEFKLESPGQSDLSLEPEGPLMAKTGNDGITERLVVKYRGITWENQQRAVFKVRCRLKDDNEGTYFIIDVGKNVRSMLNDLKDAASSLALNNPEFEDGSPAMGMVYKMLKMPSRRILGLLYNFRDHYYNFKSYKDELLDDKSTPLAYPELHIYTCGELCDRILHWASKRRCGKENPESSLSMNGIELGRYVFSKLHDFFGLHMSGSDIYEDPRFIDPWWNQRFDENVVMTIRNEIMNLTYGLSLLVTCGLFFGLVIQRLILLSGIRIEITEVPKIVEQLCKWFESLAAKKPDLLHTVFAIGMGTLSFRYAFYGFEPRIYFSDDALKYKMYDNGLMSDIYKSLYGGKELPIVEPIENCNEGDSRD